MIRHLLPIALTALAACAATDDLAAPPEPLGDFRKGYAIAVAPDPVKAPVSRTATPEEWEAAMTRALDDRFDRFAGTRLYHLGVSIDGYALAPPGIPVLLAPKSALIVNVTIWDDATQTKLNAEPHRITVLENFGAASVIGTGITRTREEQIANLSENAARAIERWMRQNGDWFGGMPEDLPDDPTIVAGAGPDDAATVPPPVAN